MAALPSRPRSPSVGSDSRPKHLIFLAIFCLSGVLCPAPASATEPVTISLEGFRELLAPSGTWVELPSHGAAWRPNPLIVGKAFHPYATRGHWELSDGGWSFESDFAWGWATFHYGRWAADETWGWVWLPDTRRAAAWVEWREAAGVVGWAPLAPDGWRSPPGHVGWFFVPAAAFLERTLPDRALARPDFTRDTRPARVGPDPHAIADAAGVKLVPRADGPIQQPRVHRPKPERRPPPPVVPEVRRDPPPPPLPPAPPPKRPHKRPGLRVPRVLDGSQPTPPGPARRRVAPSRSP